MTPCHVLFQKLDGQIEMAFDRPYGHLKLFGYLFCLYPLQISHEENLFPPGWHLFHQEIQVFVKVFFIEVFQRVVFIGDLLFVLTLWLFVVVCFYGDDMPSYHCRLAQIINAAAINNGVEIGFYVPVCRKRLPMLPNI